MEILDGQRKQKNARFVTTHHRGAVFDQQSYDRACLLIGLKGYVTNIACEIMPASEVISSSCGLWNVEQSFSDE